MTLLSRLFHKGTTGKIYERSISSRVRTACNHDHGKHLSHWDAAESAAHLFLRGLAAMASLRGNATAFLYSFVPNTKFILKAPQYPLFKLLLIPSQGSPLIPLQ